MAPPASPRSGRHHVTSPTSSPPSHHGAGQALGVGLVEGVGELDVAAPFEVYASSFAARTVPIAAGRTVTTRHGLRLIAAPADATAPRVDRLIVPGAHSLDEVGPRLAGWAASRGLRVELLQADGEFSFDAMLRDLAAHADRATAHVTAKSIEYPTGHLHLARRSVAMAAHHHARPDHRNRHRRRAPPGGRRPGRWSSHRYEIAVNGGG